MKRTITTGLVAVVFLGLSPAALEQDWYHDRDGRYSGDHARSVLRATVAAETSTTQ